jgi:hypothetical protein
VLKEFKEKEAGRIGQVQAEVYQSFQRGVAVAMDPLNDDAIRHGGKAITTLSSHWLARFCPVCQHTFRIGDEVFIDEQGVVCHFSTLLPCHQGAEASPRTSKETSVFFQGMDETYPPPGDVPIIRLEEGHELLAPQSRQFRRHRCAVCGHTFRLNDHVVICPCSPNEPQCITAIHRDPIHGLHCFDAWNPGVNKQEFCPVTSSKIAKI